MRGYASFPSGFASRAAVFAVGGCETEKTASVELSFVYGS